METVQRVYVTKRPGLDVESAQLLETIRHILKVESIEGLEMMHRYDIEGLNPETFCYISENILAEANVDQVFYEEDILDGYDEMMMIRLLKGQYDQRADSAKQCIELYDSRLEVRVEYAKVIGFKGQIKEAERALIQKYLINPVEAELVSREKPQSLALHTDEPGSIPEVNDFTQWNNEELRAYHQQMGFAMTLKDLAFCQDYFRQERRNPTETELKVIDTYWSDHCRHTTFNTSLEHIDFESSPYGDLVKESYEDYLQIKQKVKPGRPVTLMDLACINSRWLRKKGLLNNLDESEEINACSLRIPVESESGIQHYLLQFKNETHNHPTEIEPFGGAATCLGGAIRDPLAGRAYVYQGMRVTGSGDPNEKIEDTLAGKLPQMKISKEAANGFSSYGNQIGLATGEVKEYYHPGFKAKRMEVGAVIGAVPENQVKRELPQPGDKVLLVGGKTGRDGCGGATGSSKKHEADSIETCGAEVQKGNPVEERKLQRLFRIPEFSIKIKRCNDFGAGGVAVAVGELAEGLQIDLDKVPKKYMGLSGTELAISESQERMAIVVDEKDVAAIIALAHSENTEAVVIAEVTEEPLLVMTWKQQRIVKLHRSFLDTNGVTQTMDVQVKGQIKAKKSSTKIDLALEGLAKKMGQLNIASQKHLVSQFDSTIGTGSVMLPYGGNRQLTPADGMAAYIPVVESQKDPICSLMAHGYDPNIAQESPYHGGLYAVLTSVAKIVAMGGYYGDIRLSLQEYFQKLEEDPQKWGQPLAALLGAFKVQYALDLAAIGGKDSMSGTFETRHVPPSLISFAVATAPQSRVLTQWLKAAKHRVIYLKGDLDERGLPDFEGLRRAYEQINQWHQSGSLFAAKHVGAEGPLASLALMAFGNGLGLELSEDLKEQDLSENQIGGILLEVDQDFIVPDNMICLGTVISDYQIKWQEKRVDLSAIEKAWQEPLSKIFAPMPDQKAEIATLTGQAGKSVYQHKHLRPKVIIPVFPGSNCEYDMERRFRMAGAETQMMVFRNQSPEAILASVEALAQGIETSQILALPGGFSAGDEPAGSGKFIATVLKNSRVAQSIDHLLKANDGLILGICNGFQALIKTGLISYGEVRNIQADMPTLVHNQGARHIAQIVETRIVTNKSPWLQDFNVGDRHHIAVSHGEGKLYASEAMLAELIQQNCIATQYIDRDGQATMKGTYNPNGSLLAIEGLISPDGKIFGKMGHSERYVPGLYKDMAGQFDQDIFASGVAYFTGL